MSPAEKALSEKVALLGTLPPSCNVCQKEFDKKNKAMIQSWKVVVRQETVRIFCPDCIKKTQEIISEHYPPKSECPRENT